MHDIHSKLHIKPLAVASGCVPRSTEHVESHLWTINMASSSAPHCFSKRAAAANAISLGAMLAARDFQYLLAVGKKNRPAQHERVDVRLLLCCLGRDSRC